jgi:uncharacterized protein YlxW (UPF0749 family)
MADHWDAEKASDAVSLRDPDDQLNAAGNKIMNLLHEAAGRAESKTRGATEHAQRLSDQLRAAQSRIEDLEAKVNHYRERVDRAEQWLHRIYTEIEARFPTARAFEDTPGRHR